ncbi:TonB-dependent siderophore receptor [Agrobacterium sp. P15N1-A]|uniref:TonB-dependent siderophore receptor n=1 Tax=Agrobacterium sp. P15N1-A TaxID=3342820 RepID=UPI0037D72967
MGNEFSSAHKGTNRGRKGRGALFFAFLATTTTLAAGIAAQPAFAQTVYSVPAGPLNKSLATFGKLSGTQISYDASIARGKLSQGVSRATTREQAIVELLRGTGLVYSFTDATSVIIAAPVSAASAAAAGNSTLLEPITVQGARGASVLQQDGLAQDGYRTETLSSLGLLGQTAIRDTPFSVTVAPRELIQNIQAQSPEDIYRVLPTIRSQTPQMSGWAPMANIRGFTTYDTAEDGFRRSYSHATVLEDKERTEVLSGLSGFLYGAASPAGMINYVYKRPTQERLNSVTVGNYGGAQAFVHGDFGGRIDPEGDMGYRLNIVRSAGDTAIDDQNVDRFLASGAFDWNITDRLKLELNASYSKYKMDAPNSYWFVRAGVTRPDAPDASKNWSQPWIHDEIEKKRYSAKLTYDVNDAITLRGGYMREYVDRPVQDHTMNSIRAPGQYYQLAMRSGETKNTFEAANAFADVSFDTGAVSHKLTVGYHMFQDRSWSTVDNPSTGYIGPFPMSSPLHLPEPAFPANTSPLYKAGYARNHNFVVGDQIEFSEQWSALVGANYSVIQTQSLNSAGVRTAPDYDEGRLSPSVSLLFKPIEQVTLYGSYIEGLEQGGVAPTTTVNSGQIMAPMVSKQKEIGIKGEVGDLLLTAALFDISKAYELTTDANLYSQDGRQRHRGVEFTATGKVTDDLTVLGGLTFLDAQVEGGTYDGKRPMNVANVLAKVYAEYEVPTVEGLFLTGGLYYTGKQWANSVNNDRLPSYVTADLGLRYTTENFGNPLTFRLNVSNITDENYWQNSYCLGAPRTVSFSVQAKF